MKKRFVHILFIIVLILATIPAAAQKETDWFEKGINAEKERKYLEAIDAFTEAIKQNPEFAPPYVHRAELVFRFYPSECVSAHIDLTNAIRLDSTNADALYKRGLVNYYMMNNERGKKDMEMAAALGHKKASEYLMPKAGQKKEHIVYVRLCSAAEAGDPAVICFDTDKSTIKKEYTQYLNETARTLSNNSRTVLVLIAGHADCTGSDEYNDALSLRRAEAVQFYLSEKSGISPDRIIVKAYGESKPVASNKSKEGRAKNRRVELIGLQK
ncbi:MAG: OmpA family protein [Syntrophales bacterium]|jgi:outer membrane protein OmpA-like peptidoglycan-associated protein|nr:OmpA family protein [Syntrophales bacterium]MDY0044485.1 OmpA family protein [Syntrophales bacterium]